MSLNPNPPTNKITPDHGCGPVRASRVWRCTELATKQMGIPHSSRMISCVLMVIQDEESQVFRGILPLLFSP